MMMNETLPRHTASHRIDTEDVIDVKEHTDVQEVLVRRVEELQDQGVNAVDISKLKKHGINTVLAVVQSTRKELCNIKGLSEAKVEKILDASMSLEAISVFHTGRAVLEKRQSIVRISTGSQQFDTMLMGGFESSSITEIFGENRTGKTQICHTLCVTAQLPYEMNGGNGKVVYIDTEGTFRPEKIGMIAERFNLDGEAVLDNILYARAYTHEHMSHLLTAAAACMIENPFSLLIVDSIMALFRVDFSGRGELSERQQVLGKFLSKLTKISEQFNIAIVITNQVMADPAPTMTLAAPVPKPIGGHVLGHASTTRLYVRKARGETRVVKVYDSPSLPESEASFALSNLGIQDVSE